MKQEFRFLLHETLLNVHVIVDVEKCHVNSHRVHTNLSAEAHAKLPEKMKSGDHETNHMTQSVDGQYDEDLFN